MSVATATRSSSTRGPARRRKKRVLQALVVIVVVLVALRVVAPLGLRSAANRHLARNPEYTGRVGDVSLAMMRGAIRLDDLSFDYRERPSGAPAPLLQVRAVDVSLAWGELLRGRVHTRIWIEEPVITVIQSEVKQATEEVGEGGRPTPAPDWPKALEELLPIEVAYLDVQGGRFRFVDQHSDPAIDLALTEIDLKASGLRNRPKTDAEEDLPARIELTARTVGEGRIQFLANADPLASQPRFRVNVEITDVNLPALNDFLQAYGSVKVSTGKFETYLEANARDGGFEGYVKPFFEDVEFTKADAKERSLGQRLWEQVVSLVANLVKNRERDQVATRVPFSGRFDGPDIGILASVFSTLRHGFIEALGQGLEGAVKPEPVGERKAEGGSAEGQHLGAAVGGR